MYDTLSCHTNMLMTTSTPTEALANTQTLGDTLCCVLAVARIDLQHLISEHLYNAALLTND